jgi:hypothetical protein
LQRALVLQAKIALQDLRDKTLDRIFFLYGNSEGSGGYEGFLSAVRCITQCGLPGDGSLSAVLAPISPVGGSSGRVAQAGVGLADDLAGARQLLIATLRAREAAARANNVVLGLRNFGLKEVAQKVGGRTLLDEAASRR